MLGKSIRYWRLRRGLTKKDLAMLVGVSPMAVTHYENNARTPDLQTARKLANALNIRLGDLMAARAEGHQYTHAEFRKNARFGAAAQACVRESVEDYFDRFFCAVDALGEFVLPDAPECHALTATGDPEKDALALRKYLGFACSGAIGNLMGEIENRGVLIFHADIDDDQFSGMNGTVDGRPYVAINRHMNTERQRSTLAHELAHIFFRLEGMDEKAVEKYATAISGAFLLPKEDAIRELGIRRSWIGGDMVMVAAEYGVSMLLLTKRAQQLKIISDEQYTAYMMKASQRNWRKNEPTRIPPERPVLFEQLVLRAIGEEEMTLSRGAELLRIPCDAVAQMMHPEQEVSCNT